MADVEIRKINFGQQSASPCYNQEVADLIELCDDGCRQITACPSAKKRNWQEADLKIARNIHARMQNMVDQFKADPEQYAPNADKVEMNLGDTPECMQPENFGALLISRQIARLRTQLRNGSSSEQTTGFHEKELDYSLQPMLTKLGLYIQAEEDNFAAGNIDYFPDVRDQEADETTPGHPDNQ
jgi:hypothetical protein